MPKFTITPASSPDVNCEFEIPTSGKPIEFSVPRMDYVMNMDTAMLEWATKRMEATPVLDDDGNPVIEDGEPKTEPAEDISDREVILAQLRIAGVPQKTITRLEKLTNGELSEIFKHWSEASRVSVGESQASDN